MDIGVIEANLARKLAQSGLEILFELDPSPSRRVAVPGAGQAQEHSAANGGECFQDPAKGAHASHQLFMDFFEGVTLILQEGLAFRGVHPASVIRELPKGLGWDVNSQDFKQ